MSVHPPNSTVPIFVTADGSPTLQWSRPDGYTEKMHHSGGALAESLFIYHYALQEVVARRWPARVVSVGLGLGYNEWITLAEISASGIEASQWHLWSFETESILKESFVASAMGNSSLELQPWIQVFDQVRDLVAAQFGLSSEKLRLLAVEGLRSGHFELRGAFPEDIEGVNSATCVFYDAFSNKMNSELWLESMIAEELKAVLAPHAVLATYAATGSLNRALKILGFSLQNRSGFQGKRESTFAIRD